MFTEIYIFYHYLLIDRCFEPFIVLCYLINAITIIDFVPVKQEAPGKGLTFSVDHFIMLVMKHDCIHQWLPYIRTAFPVYWICLNRQTWNYVFSVTVFLVAHFCQTCNYDPNIHVCQINLNNMRILNYLSRLSGSTCWRFISKELISFS